MSCSLWTAKMEAVLPPPWKQAIRGRGSSGKDIARAGSWDDYSVI